MTYSRIFLLALFAFSAQVLADTQCIDLTGTYQCSIPSYGTSLDLTATQTLNSRNAPVLTIGVAESEGGTISYIADKEIHNDYVATCQKDYFSVLSRLPDHPSHFMLTVYQKSHADEIHIKKFTLTVKSDENNKAEIETLENLGEMRCTKK